jgi:perosamine synthetase
MIPLFKPFLKGNELNYIKNCIDSTWISSNGKYVNLFENEIAKFTSAKYAIACVNGTSALHIALLLSDVKSDDHVIVPNITFVASLNSIKYTGATPILIDVNKDDWQIDLDLLEDFLIKKTHIKKIKNKKYSFLKSNNKRIKAIMPVHVLGNICDMSRLIKLAKIYKLDVIEDSTESLGSYYKNKHSGTIGKFGTFSFNGNKIISTGSGGMIVTNNKNLAVKAKHLTTTAKTSNIDYIHDEIGYNYRLVNVLAALGLAQIENLNLILKKKKEIDFFYRNKLNNIGDIKFQIINSNCNVNSWLVTIQTKKMRDLLNYLKNNGVETRPLWMPMNQLTMFKNLDYINNSDESSKIYETCLSIPCFPSISSFQLNRVADLIKQFFQQ